MSRRVAHFSCGAASAVATKISNPDVIWYAATGSEDPDNERFRRDCESWFGKKVEIIKSSKFEDTWDVWEKYRYIAGPAGAPCTRELKVAPLRANSLPDDIHIFGYTSNERDVTRAEALRENWPDLNIETPLIERKLTKAACLSLLESVGIPPPRTYEMGFHNANCIPCCKARAPGYWALIRDHFPDQFYRMVLLSRNLNVKLLKMNQKLYYIDELPEGQKYNNPIAPACDILCQQVEDELYSS